MWVSWWPAIAGWLRVDNVAFTLFGYAMSYVELVGTVFNLAAVWLAVRNRIATWPVGIVGTLLFLALFYQIRLYSDAVEQIYYIVTGAYGWWLWTNRKRPGASVLPIRLSAPATLIAAGAVTAALSVAAGAYTSHLHQLWPLVFPEAASYPYLDALTTVMSFTANLLMARRRLECWYYWIVVDVIGVGLYYVKGVVFVALLYAIFLVLATVGLLSWMRSLRAESPAQAAR